MCKAAESSRHHFLMFTSFNILNLHALKRHSACLHRITKQANIACLLSEPASGKQNLSSSA
jgi:hypothetical protein